MLPPVIPTVRAVDAASAAVPAAVPPAAALAPAEALPPPEPPPHPASANTSKLAATPRRKSPPLRVVPTFGLPPRGTPRSKFSVLPMVQTFPLPPWGARSIQRNDNRCSVMITLLLEDKSLLRSKNERAPPKEAVRVACSNTPPRPRLGRSVPRRIPKTRKRYEMRSRFATLKTVPDPNSDWFILQV